MNTAYFLTLLRLFGAPFLLAPFIVYKAPATVVLFCYIFFALTDFLDGYYARIYKLQSSLGAFLDQFADKVFVFSVMFATVFTHQCPWWWALALGIRELLVMGLRDYGMQKQISLPVVYAAKLKTTFQLVLFSVILVDRNVFYVELVSQFIFCLTLFFSYASAYLYVKKVGIIRDLMDISKSKNY